MCMQVIIERLEGEGVAARQAAEEGAAAKQAALQAQYKSALQAAQDSGQKHAERCGSTVAVVPVRLGQRHAGRLTL